MQDPLLPSAVLLNLELPAGMEEFYRKYDKQLRRISLLIHEYQELAFHEFKSCGLLSEFLEQEGFFVERGIAGDETAFVATFSQGKGPVVSFNAVPSFPCHS